MENIIPVPVKLPSGALYFEQVCIYVLFKDYESFCESYDVDTGLSDDAGFDDGYLCFKGDIKFHNDNIYEISFNNYNGHGAFSNPLFFFIEEDGTEYVINDWSGDMLLSYLELFILKSFALEQNSVV